MPNSNAIALSPSRVASLYGPTRGDASQEGLVAAMANAKRQGRGIDDQRPVRRGRHRDEQHDIQLAMHSAELVKIKISSLRQFSALIAQKSHRVLN